ncbi:hypothetical protein AB2B41_01860 [Marimonas sp. MJW-29]|uniref:Uncharacterized protein n=1 Tax=Sulfitobacter sediminis TaxID=3234186 RepID=A0ABV3RHA1_9RHOB
MLGIYADVFRTATFTNSRELYEVPPAKTAGNRRRWRLGRRKVLVDLDKL